MFICICPKTIYINIFLEVKNNFADSIKILLNSFNLFLHQKFTSHNVQPCNLDNLNSNANALLEQLIAEVNLLVMVDLGYYNALLPYLAIFLVFTAALQQPLF